MTVRGITHKHGLHVVARGLHGLLEFGTVFDAEWQPPSERVVLLVLGSPVFKIGQKCRRHFNTPKLIVIIERDRPQDIDAVALLTPEQGV
jgi:hypothetical protein